jgi:hypothetical protein
MPKGREKALETDASSLPQARGKALEVVPILLRDLPPGESYRVIFLERRLEAVLASQRRMLDR